ncbi:MAG: chorismate synthase [Planctomycetota bacterium]|nr:MAG: chorismate synthase [Planctomycetota bacterium]
MSSNSIGKEFTITTFGESHGPAIGVIIDGMPPGFSLSEEDIQKDLDRRKPGQSKITTQRKESDAVKILSGVFEGLTTGHTIALLIENADARSKNYDSIKDVFRPGHADFTYFHKYGVRDYRGGGRSSGRETACRVAAGAVAKKLLEKFSIKVTAATTQVGTVKSNQWVEEDIEKNIVRSPDINVVEEMIQTIDSARKDLDSVGGMIECRINNVPIGLGEPIYDKLDCDIAKAILSIGAFKGIEFGCGFDAIEMKGSEHNDEINKDGFVTNNSGGILGGISNGEPIIFKMVVKPTASIAKPQKSIDKSGQEITVETHGRHDPCILPRAVPVVEAMASITIADHLLRSGIYFKDIN